MSGDNDPLDSEPPHRGALNAERVEAMRRAAASGDCYITPDGWCATHSTGKGPVYCTPPAQETSNG